MSTARKASTPPRPARSRREVPALPPADAVHATTRAAWRRWLARHHQRSTGVWLISWKAATGKPRLAREEAVAEALAFGWVDSLPRALDAERGMLWFAPRKPGTGWSRVNKRLVARLMAAGRMMPAGLAKVEAAKRDGSWTKLDAVERLAIPPDLARALRGTPKAAAFFAAFPRSVKRAILEWIGNAKRPETRTKRVTETARLAARNLRANQWRQPGAAGRSWTR